MLWLWCGCAVPALCLWCGCSVPVLCLWSACVVPVLCPRCGCAVPVLCLGVVAPCLRCAVPGWSVGAPRADDCGRARACQIGLFGR
eukprot:10029701-Alexandrium_andersonii.AAC.1